MGLSYTAEIVNNPEGEACAVLDTASVDFSRAALGRKAAKTLVREAKGGELIHTRNSEGKIESTYVARPGDAIFINLHDRNDMYVPGESDGTRWKFSELVVKGYEIIGEDRSNGGVLVKSAQTSKILPGIVDRPVCIKDAWGKGQHQFLYKGATLKDAGGGRVTGIDKEAFDKGWEIVAPLRP